MNNLLDEAMHADEPLSLTDEEFAGTDVTGRGQGSPKAQGAGQATARSAKKYGRFHAVCSVIVKCNKGRRKKALPTTECE